MHKQRFIRAVVANRFPVVAAARSRLVPVLGETSVILNRPAGVTQRLRDPLRPWLLRSFSAAADSSENPPEETHQSETKRILEIVTHSLYTERDIFLRELVSNASDALEKRRFEAAASGSDPGTQEIRVRTASAPDSASSPESAKSAGSDGADSSLVLTLEDSGVGMDRSEVMANLGTIARSGTKAFLEKVGSEGKGGGEGLIGRFGVGFYSAFMVADKVEVVTCRGNGAEPIRWASSGDGAYSLRPATAADSPPEQGTRVVLHLKKDAAQFSERGELRKVLKRYSSFIPFPVLLDGDRVNAVEALWTRPPASVKQEEHEEFYRFISADKSSKASFTLHFRADAPLSVQALLYFPDRMQELTAAGLVRSESGVALYSRKVLIQQQAAGLLPPWLRFLRGAVDCEDVPLNIGRELLQDAAVVRKLRGALTQRAIKFLSQKAAADPAKYEEWYRGMAIFIKEGACSEDDPKRREDIARLLRYESTALPPGQLTSLEAHVERRKASLKAARAAAKAAKAAARGAERAPAGEKDDEEKDKEEEEEEEEEEEGVGEIFYLVASSRSAAQGSPYLEAFRSKGIEVILVYSAADEIVMKGMADYEGAVLVNAEEATEEALGSPAASAGASAAAGAPGGSAGGAGAGAAGAGGGSAELSEEAMDDLTKWIAETVLPGRVRGVCGSKRLVDSPALLSGHMTDAMRQMFRAQQLMAAPGSGSADSLGPLDGAAVLELNPRHPLIAAIAAAAKSEDPKRAKLAAAVAEQVFDNARVAAGAIDDPKAMISRLNEICAAALASADSAPPQ